MSIKVNGEVIPDEAIEFEFNRLVKFYSGHMSPAKIREQTDALRERAKQQAIGAKLLLDEARKLDIVISEDEINVRLKKIIKDVGGQESFHQRLKSQNTTEATVRAGIEQGCRVEQLVAQVTGGVSDPGEEEIRAHFEEHKGEYERPPRVQAQHILIRPASPSVHDKAVARSRLEEIRRRIGDGADFAQEAAAYSDCPSGKKGGSLGWFSRGMTLPEFDAAVFSMDVGELSEIVETPIGMHLIRKTAEEEGGPATFDDVHESVREFLRHVRRGQALSAHVEELKSKAQIEED